MKRPRMWLFAVLAILAAALLGSTAGKQERRPIHQAALALAGESVSSDVSEMFDTARRNPGSLLRANTLPRR